LRIAHGLAHLVQDFTGNRSARQQLEAQIVCIQVRTGNNSRGKRFVLLVLLVDVALAARREHILARRNILERKAPAISSRYRLHPVVSRLPRKNHLGAGQRLATERIENNTADPKRRW
jgi:hypothetical protein